MKILGKSLENVVLIKLIEDRASYNLLRKCGFYAEGIIRDMYLFRGKYYDHYTMSFLLKDYKYN